MIASKEGIASGICGDLNSVALRERGGKINLSPYGFMSLTHRFVLGLPVHHNSRPHPFRHVRYSAHEQCNTP